MNSFSLIQTGIADQSSTSTAAPITTTITVATDPNRKSVTRNTLASSDTASDASPASASRLACDRRRSFSAWRKRIRWYALGAISSAVDRTAASSATK